MRCIAYGGLLKRSASFVTWPRTMVANIQTVTPNKQFQPTNSRCARIRG